MSSDLERLLEPLGWQMILTEAPEEADRILFLLRSKGGRLSQTPSSAKIKGKDVEKAIRGLMCFLEWLADRDENERRVIAPRHRIFISDRWESYDVIEDFVETSETMISSVRTYARHLAKETHGPAGKKNWSAIPVAQALLAANILGKGDLPEISNPYDQGMNEFSVVAKQVFDYLKVGHGHNWRNVCQAAKRQFPDSEVQRLKFRMSEHYVPPKRLQDLFN